ncbi:unnamed protein product [Cylindrotheca closterium]|uniref:G-patch domain-containing protein n=1 Tax=Cylindrotheca closterium TaxID=2856 RepID=A0AAD2FX01_9STRA|nr:unnamed protein product [Cylindrotheca closterium]
MTKESIASRSSFLDIAGSKLRSRLTSQVNESASEGVTSKFARRHLEKLGWTEGTGLGKRRSGITTHIKVQKRADEQGGLGKSVVDENLKIGSEWWKSSTGDVLAKLASNKKKKSKKKDKKDKKKEKKGKEKKKIFTDEELFQATGGARFGMRQGARQEGKWTRTEKSKTLRSQEEAAKQQVEWDGKAAPKVILKADSDGKKKKRKRSRDEDEVESSSVQDNSTEEQRKRKRKKKDKKKES